MSKNLTRKGLAFGAIVALGASLFSAAPAFAADELTLTPTTGTQYKTIEGEAFSLSTGLAPTTSAGNVVQLKYQIVTSDNTIVPTITSSGTSGATTESGVTQPTNTKVYKSANLPGVGSAQSISLASPTSVASGTPVTAVVTAFFDANANGLLDSGEYSSAARTVTWVDAADVAATVVVSALTAGDTTATATLSFDGINNSQIAAAHTGLLFKQNDGSSTTLTGLASGAGLVTPTYSASKDTYSGTTVAFTAVNVTAGSLVNNSIKVTALYNVTGTVVATDVVGTAVTKDAIARSINSIDADASGATGVAAGAAVQAVPGTAGSLAVSASNVKGNVVKVVATIKDNASTPAVVAGAAFKVTVAGTQTLSSTNSIAINGTAYTAALSSALDATSDASGQITLTIENKTALVAGNTVTLSIAGQNITNLVTITYAAPVYTVVDVADNAGSFNRTVLKAAAYSLSYKVVDQFGDAPSVAAATSAFRLVDVVTTTNTGTYYSNLAADGTATISFATAAAAGNTVHTVQVQKTADSFANFTYLDDGIDHNGATAGGLCVPATGVDCAAVVTTVVVKATAAEVTASKITIGTMTKGAGQASLTIGALNALTGSANLSSAAFAAYEGRFAKTAAPALGKGYTTAPTHTAGAWVAGTAGAAGDARITIPVTVNDSTLAATALDGVSTTISAKGFLFVVTNGSKTTMGVDSLTFLADNASTSVDVYSHVTGEQSIVITSGSATVTKKVTFTNYGTEVAAVALGTLPAQAQAGSTVTVSAVATDKWGNVVPNVQIAFSNTGAGYVQDTAAQLSDSKGAVAGRVIVLQNDLGTSYITATAAKAKTLLSADLASAKSVEFGLVDADVVAGGHRVFVNSEFAKGRTITVTIDGVRKYSKVQTTDNAVELAFTQKKAGAHTVTVRISGGVVFSEKVITN